MMLRRDPRHREQPNWLRLLGRDAPSAYEFAKRAQEKTKIVASELLKRQAPRTITQPVREDLFANELREIGVQPGDVLMVHSSWNAARPLAASPVALIDTLRELLGSDGTLCMPAFPNVPATDGRAEFDLRRTPSHAGLITEIFRRIPGVRRSPQFASVAALGPLSLELTREHHLSPYTSGELSPHAKFAAVGAKMLCIGVGAEYNTMFHCGEDILKDEFPVQVYNDPPISVDVRTEDGNTVQTSAYELSKRWRYCGDAARLLPYFEKQLERRNIAGVEISLIPAAAFLETLLALARGGVHMYGFRFPAKDRWKRASA